MIKCFSTGGAMSDDIPIWAGYVSHRLLSEPRFLGLKDYREIKNQENLLIS